MGWDMRFTRVDLLKQKRSKMRMEFTLNIPKLGDLGFSLENNLGFLGGNDDLTILNGGNILRVLDLRNYFRCGVLDRGASNREVFNQHFVSVWCIVCW
jgi:hypothetical protein